MSYALLFVTSVVIIFLLHKLLWFWRAVRSLSNHPGYRTVLAAMNVFGNLVPPIPGIAPGRHHLFKNKHKSFEYFGWDIYASVSMIPATMSVVLADAGAIKEVSSSRARFPKPVNNYRVLTFFGRNIVASEGNEWKKYRKICAPAFSERNNKLVWDETVSIMNDLFTNVWGRQESVIIDHCVDVTLPIALFVIGAAGFGRRISWQDDAIMPPGHQLTFKDALHTVSTDVFIRLIVPDWALGLTARLRRIRLAFQELEIYMLEMIRERQTLEKQVQYDLFSSLLDANNEDGDEAKLTDSELIGNIFIFLLAGHETTAHTLSFTFGMLALYPEEQDILYRHIKSVLPNGRMPTYEDMPRLTQSMAVFYETLRMYPPVAAVPKYSEEDTTLVTENSFGDKKIVPVPKGTYIVFDIPGLHYNPRYWKDPEVFRPTRFLEDWPRDAFLPFSGGARACLGRRFFETEGIAILTMLVMRYKIEIKEEPQFAGESFEARKERIMRSQPGLTINPVRMPLVFRRRNDH